MEHPGNYAMCDLHRVMRREADKRRKSRRKTEGLCTRCGTENSLEGLNLCNGCSKQKSGWGIAHRQKRIDQGICYLCKEPVSEDSTSNRCASCGDKVKQRSKERTARGVCTKCENPKLENSAHCFHCWMKYRSYQFLGSRKFYKQLLILWVEQKGLCSYTKVPLVPGKSTHLDHKTPKSRGGSNDISNLHWVDRRINLLKDTQTHEEFINGIPGLIKLLERIQ